MSATQGIGPRRLVVGAHYGTIGYIVQRVTAIILATYSFVFLACVLFTPINYETWKGFFTFGFFGVPLGQLFASLAFFSLVWHAWIGIRDIWMDYIKPAGLRLGLQVFTVLWLTGSILFFSKIIWSL